MRTAMIGAVLSGALMAACSPAGMDRASMQGEEWAVSEAADAAVAAEAFAPSPPPPDGSAAPAEAGFFMAYSYAMGLQLPARSFLTVMDGHVRACTDAGPTVCQVITATREGDPESSIYGSLHLRATPVFLNAFMTTAANDAETAGGQVRSRSVQQEDLTRQIVDTEARLTALRTLRDRLQALLSGRPGRLSDLLELERELARVQGELDSLTATLAALRQRVDMSELSITYQLAPRPVTSRTFEPIADAFSGFLRTLSYSLAQIVTLVAALLPWALVGAGVVFGLRRFGVGKGLKWPFRRQTRANAPPPPARDGAESGQGDGEPPN